MDKAPSTTPLKHLPGRRRFWPLATAVIVGLLLIYLLVAYVIMPADWLRYAHRHPALDDVPGITQTADGIPGDPLNVALIGTEMDVKNIMSAAKWRAADPLGLRSDLKIASDTILDRPYADAPVSNLFLFGRKEDLAFEQPVGDNPRHRHHVRFWRTDKLDSDGRPVWIGSAIYDRRVGLSRTTGQITHVTAPDIDAERDYLFKCLEQTGELSETYIVDDFHKIREGRNGGGDPWKTDGRLFVGIVVQDIQSKNQSSQKAIPALPEENETAIAGSKSCRDCHEEFYKLWSTSWHGLAMQPYSAEFAKLNLIAQKDEVAIDKRKYQAEIGDDEGWVREIGPSGERKYPMAHVMGGKNVYYFLTPLERGRLQVLPVAYDVHKKTWYDMAASGVRHFPDRRDEALDWTDRMFSFNTTCFNCHVSQLHTNYDLAGDTYNTTWSEPGISCESCHGSGREHIRVMENADEIEKVRDIKIIRTKAFSAEQMNDMCATCHAKLVPLSVSFQPGDKFFDHYDLVTLEHQDYYPDGRDLGENYTYTSWLMSPCVKSGKLDCNHCHTASGRMRFQGDQSNQSCMPCHENYVKNPIEHGRHEPGSKGNECIGCHMPTTRFAAMGRTDHSMLPPTPATTKAFKSPNACNLCHADKDAEWSDEWVRKWYPRDYQAGVLRRAGLIDQARKHQWQRLPEMLAELKKDNNPVYKNSLVRLLSGCEDESKWPVLLEMLQDASPLVRSSAASALGAHLTPEVVKTLLVATADESRLVRIRSAISLAALPPDQLASDSDRKNLKKAVNDFMTAMTARPDDWASYANVGNFYMERRDFPAAIGYFQTASKLEPRRIGPMVNASIAYSNMGKTEKADECLMQALKYDPENAAANFNLGLLRGEQGRLPEAENALRKALKADPQMAQAAYNLAILLADNNMDEAVEWCQKAHELRPNDPKYAYTLAFYQRQKGNLDSAVELLKQIIRREPLNWDSYFLLGDIYENRHDFSRARAVYQEALKKEQLPSPMRRQLEVKAREIESSAPAQK